MSVNLFSGGFGSPFGIAWGEVSRQGLSNTVLVVNNASHSHTVDNITLTQVHVLVVDNALHSHTVDNIVLTQVHNISVDGALHGITSDVVTLVQNITLAVNNASHAHTVDNIVLVQQHSIVVANASHAHTVDNIVLTQQHLLAIANAVHNHTADGNLVLNQYFLLNQPDSSVIGITSDEILLSQNHILVIDSTLHNVFSPLVNLFDWASHNLYSGIYILDGNDSGSLNPADAIDGETYKKQDQNIGSFIPVAPPDSGTFVLTNPNNGGYK